MRKYEFSRYDGYPRHTIFSCDFQVCEAGIYRRSNSSLFIEAEKLFKIGPLGFPPCIVEIIKSPEYNCFEFFKAVERGVSLYRWPIPNFWRAAAQRYALQVRGFEFEASDRLKAGARATAVAVQQVRLARKRFYGDGL